MFAPTLDWLYWTIGVVVALAALVLAWRALFRDRARGRFRCPKCWYDLTGAEGGAPAVPVKCSECGRETKVERKLRKTRRRWGRVVVAMVMVGASCAIALYPGVHRNGWASLLPTWFLIDTMPVFGYPTPLTDELVLRYRILPLGQAWSPPNWTSRPHFTAAERIHLANRVARGIPFVRPLSTR